MVDLREMIKDLVSLRRNTIEYFNVIIEFTEKMNKHFIRDKSYQLEASRCKFFNYYYYLMDKAVRRFTEKLRYYYGDPSLDIERKPSNGLYESIEYYFMLEYDQRLRDLPGEILFDSNLNLFEVCSVPRIKFTHYLGNLHSKKIGFLPPHRLGSYNSIRMIPSDDIPSFKGKSIIPAFLLDNKPRELTEELERAIKKAQSSEYFNEITEAMEYAKEVWNLRYESRVREYKREIKDLLDKMMNEYASYKIIEAIFPEKENILEVISNSYFSTIFREDMDMLGIFSYHNPIQCDKTILPTKEYWYSLYLFPFNIYYQYLADYIDISDNVLFDYMYKRLPIKENFKKFIIEYYANLPIGDKNKFKPMAYLRSWNEVENDFLRHYDCSTLCDTLDDLEWYGFLNGGEYGSILYEICDKNNFRFKFVNPFDLLSVYTWKVKKYYNFTEEEQKNNPRLALEMLKLWWIKKTYNEPFQTEQDRVRIQL